jgi:hypothetical protein
LNQPTAFELCRGQVTEGGVQPPGVIDLLQEPLKGGASVGLIAVLAQIDFFLLQSLHKRFRLGVGRSCQLHRMATMPIPTLKSSILTIRSEVRSSS